MGRVRSTKRGFTLVEIIVVMVILGVLATVVVPSMLGYIDKAKRQSGVAQARAVYVAAQSAVSEYSATSRMQERLDGVISSGGSQEPDKTINRIMEELLGKGFQGEYRFRLEENQVSAVEYITEDGVMITIPEGESIID